MTVGSIWTKDGLNEELKVTLGDSTKIIEKFKIGTGTTTPAETDTDLETEIGAFSAKAFDATYPQYDTNNKKITIRGTISSVEANGNTVSESALVDDGDTLIFTHDVFTGIVKNLSTEIVLEWTYKLENKS